MKRPSAEYPRIRDAVPVASEGDTVLVAPGDYVGDWFTPRMSMTLLADGGRDVTFISGGGSYMELVDPWVGNSIKISRFTFRDCVSAIQLHWEGVHASVEVGDCAFIRCGGSTGPPWPGAVLITTGRNGSWHPSASTCFAGGSRSPSRSWVAETPSAMAWWSLNTRASRPSASPSTTHTNDAKNEP